MNYEFFRPLVLVEFSGIFPIPTGLGNKILVFMCFVERRLDRGWKVGSMTYLDYGETICLKRTCRHFVLVISQQTIYEKELAYQYHLLDFETDSTTLARFTCLRLLPYNSFAVPGDWNFGTINQRLCRFCFWCGFARRFNDYKPGCPIILEQDPRNLCLCEVERRRMLCVGCYKF